MNSMSFRVLNTDNPAEADAIVLGMNLKAVQREIVQWWDCNVQHGGDHRSVVAEKRAAKFKALLGIPSHSIARWRQ